jgi:hypothetical protein
MNRRSKARSRRVNVSETAAPARAAFQEAGKACSMPNRPGKKGAHELMEKETKKRLPWSIKKRTRTETRQEADYNAYFSSLLAGEQRDEAGADDQHSCVKSEATEKTGTFDREYTSFGIRHSYTTASIATEGVDVQTGCMAGLSVLPLVQRFAKSF